MKYDEAFDLTCKKRDEFWNKIGKLDETVISFMVNPAFMGGPRWPSLRQAFCVVHLDIGTILASDGLSDPYDTMDTNPDLAKYNGLGMEFYIQTPDQLSPDSPQNWQTKLLVDASQVAVGHGNIPALLDKLKYVTLELANPGVPGELVDEGGNVGVFIGLTSSEVPEKADLPLESISLINLKLMTQAELKYGIENDAAGREKLAELYKKQGDLTFSSLDRPSVV